MRSRLFFSFTCSLSMRSARCVSTGRHPNWDVHGVRLGIMIRKATSPSGRDNESRRSGREFGSFYPRSPPDRWTRKGQCHCCPRDVEAVQSEVYVLFSALFDSFRQISTMSANFGSVRQKYRVRTAAKRTGGASRNNLSTICQQFLNDRGECNKFSTVCQWGGQKLAGSIAHRGSGT